MDEMLADCIRRLYRFVRYCKPSGPICFSQSIVTIRVSCFRVPGVFNGLPYTICRENKCCGPEGSHARTGVLRDVRLDRMCVLTEGTAFFRLVR